jgi:hypothetical protein
MKQILYVIDQLQKLLAAWAYPLFFERGFENFYHYEIHRMFIPSHIGVIGRGVKYLQCVPGEGHIPTDEDLA